MKYWDMALQTQVNYSNKSCAAVQANTCTCTLTIVTTTIYMHCYCKLEQHYVPFLINQFSGVLQKETKQHTVV